jgi:phage terminase large subunit GpA-like protein
MPKLTKMADAPKPVSSSEAILAASVAEQGESRDSEAEFTLEYPATCPRCGHEVKTLKVARLLRTRVNFVSTLPRRGRVLMCPHCRAILSAELTVT